ncbi:hypothetical protein B0O99DRAFT_617008 [Bisporella sp. PMI_857]|nr:hypothetical protein B0O99DRAFT_617008 [Bisporella sp. PMI_857]
MEAGTNNSSSSSGDGFAFFFNTGANAQYLAPENDAARQNLEQQIAKRTKELEDRVRQKNAIRKAQLSAAASHGVGNSPDLSSRGDKSIAPIEIAGSNLRKQTWRERRELVEETAAQREISGLRSQGEQSAISEKKLQLSSTKGQISASREVLGTGLLREQTAAQGETSEPGSKTKELTMAEEIPKPSSSKEHLSAVTTSLDSDLGLGRLEASKATPLPSSYGNNSTLSVDLPLSTIDGLASLGFVDPRLLTKQAAFNESPSLGKRKRGRPKKYFLDNENEMHEGEHELTSASRYRELAQEPAKALHDKTSEGKDNERVLSHIDEVPKVLPRAIPGSTNNLGVQIGGDLLEAGGKRLEGTGELTKHLRNHTKHLSAPFQTRKGSSKAVGKPLVESGGSVSAQNDAIKVARTTPSPGVPNLVITRSLQNSSSSLPLATSTIAKYIPKLSTSYSEPFRRSFDPVAETSQRTKTVSGTEIPITGSRHKIPSNEKVVSSSQAISRFTDIEVLLEEEVLEERRRQAARQQFGSKQPVEVIDLTDMATPPQDEGEPMDGVQDDSNINVNNANLPPGPQSLQQSLPTTSRGRLPISQVAVMSQSTSTSGAITNRSQLPTTQAAGFPQLTSQTGPATSGQLATTQVADTPQSSTLPHTFRDSTGRIFRADQYRSCSKNHGRACPLANFSRKIHKPTEYRESCDRHNLIGPWAHGPWMTNQSGDRAGAGSGPQQPVQSTVINNAWAQLQQSLHAMAQAPNSTATPSGSEDQSDLKQSQLAPGPNFSRVPSGLVTQPPTPQLHRQPKHSTANKVPLAQQLPAVSRAPRLLPFGTRTLARDILLATNSHPSEPGLNAHLRVLADRYDDINDFTDLSTIRWDLLESDSSPLLAGNRQPTSYQSLRPSAMPPAIENALQRPPIHNSQPGYSTALPGQGYIAGQVTARNNGPSMRPMSYQTAPQQTNVSGSSGALVADENAIAITRAYLQSHSQTSQSSQSGRRATTQTQALPTPSQPSQLRQDTTQPQRALHTQVQSSQLGRSALQAQQVQQVQRSPYTTSEQKFDSSSSTPQARAVSVIIRSPKPSHTFAQSQVSHSSNLGTPSSYAKAPALASSPTTIPQSDASSRSFGVVIPATAAVRASHLTPLRVGSPAASFTSGDSTKKKRGRPFKNPEGTPKPQAESKKRGRPFKNAENATSRASQSEDNVVKKRGRPSKNPLERIVKPLREPRYMVFICEWEGCRAKLHNLDTLKVHILNVHYKKDKNGISQCKWGQCEAADDAGDYDDSEDNVMGGVMAAEDASNRSLDESYSESDNSDLPPDDLPPDNLPWENLSANRASGGVLTADDSGADELGIDELALEAGNVEVNNVTTEKRSEVKLRRLRFHNRQDWENHIQNAHLVPYAWHMGDGPKVDPPSESTHLTQLSIPAHTTGIEASGESKVLPPWLFDDQGRQVINSIEGQQIERGDAKKNNKRRLQDARREEARQDMNVILKPVKNPEEYMIIDDDDDESS